MTVPVHDALWHLREAERLLEDADAADQERKDGDWKRWSFAERSRAHSALAAAMAAQPLQVRLDMAQPAACEHPDRRRRLGEEVTEGEREREATL